MWVQQTIITLICIIALIPGCSLEATVASQNSQVALSQKTTGMVSLIPDDRGRVHMAYVEQKAGELRYACFDGKGWNISIVDNDRVGWSNSLAMDQLTGRPCLAYYACGSIRFASNEGNGWQIQTVETANRIGPFVSLCMDNHGLPHITYYADGSLKYATNIDNKWQCEVIEGDVGDTAVVTCLMMDGNNNPQVSYEVNGRLKYAVRRHGDGWRNEIIDNDVQMGMFSSLALHPVTDKPCIAYHLKGGELRYASREEDGWNVCQIDSGARIYNQPALSIDNNGRSHLGYFDEKRGVLKYACGMDGRWEVNALNSQLGEDVALRADNCGGIRISTFDPIGSGLSNITIGSVTPVVLLTDDGFRVIACPNPALGATSVRFQGTEDITSAIIKIFNIAGELVKTLEPGQYLWETRDVASGVYVFLVNMPDGRRYVGKVAVIR